MTQNSVGAAISTTGDRHRIGFLETSVSAWRNVMDTAGFTGPLLVTVDGDEDDVARADAAVGDLAEVWQVGQRPGAKGRHGVAVNKNTGIELLMDRDVEHLFLCDDDTWPQRVGSLRLHMNLGEPHSIVCWGKSRLVPFANPYAAEWAWPRGVLMYTHRDVIESVGGMVEEFGPGGHEHVEWSNRIHNFGFTLRPFLSPVEYAWSKATGAREFWHAEDMRRPGETDMEWTRRKAANTTIQRLPGEWARINAVMDRQRGATTFEPFRSHQNRRGSATLARNLMSRGAEG